MKKALLMVLSGAIIGSTSFSCFAINQSEVETVIEANPGFTRAKAHNALEAFESVLKEEASSGHAVKLDNFGVYRPKQSAGLRNYRDPKTGGTVARESFSFVKKPDIVSQDEFITKAARKAGVTEEEMKVTLASYEASVKTTLMKGGSAAFSGSGTYSLGVVGPRHYKLPNGQIGTHAAHKVARFKPYGDNRKIYDFKADDNLQNLLN